MIKNTHLYNIVFSRDDYMEVFDETRKSSRFYLSS